MGRHSAPDDDDADDLHDDRAGVSVLTEGDPGTGRHTREPQAAPEPEGLGLIEDKLEESGPAEPAVEHRPSPVGPAVVDGPVADAPTTTMPTIDVAEHDRPLPEETTARIRKVSPGSPPGAGIPAEVDPSPGSAAASHPLPGPSADAPSSVDPQPAAKAPGGHATRADLALVRQHGDVRARCAAAVVVPFVVYVVVLVVIGKLTVHNLIWIWAPAIAAGILVGVVLDAGHKRYAAPEGEPVTEPADPA